MKPVDFRKGFLLLELSIYLIAEVIMFSSLCAVSILPLYRYFERLSDQVLAVKTINRMRTVSFISRKADIYASKTSILAGFRNNYFTFKINQYSYRELTFDDGYIKSPGGIIVDRKNQTVLKVVPVTAAVTLP
ncbi:MAG TPA: hypothetical protein PK741_06210 [Petrotogaceae bacterium]|nr:hypothetical protein [Petrotogaceae bacterium]